MELLDRNLGIEPRVQREALAKEINVGAPEWLSRLSFGLLISGSGHDPTVHGSSPMSGSALTARSLLEILSLPLSLPLSCCLSLSKLIN